MSTMPQRERSDTPKATRGWHKRFQNEHRATTRAICRPKVTRGLRERFQNDRPKVTRGLRKRFQNEHRARTRAIRHAQSDDRVARAHVRFSQNIARATKHEYWKGQKRRFTQVSATFVEVYNVLRLPRKARGIRSPAPATRNHHHVPNQIRQRFHKTRFSPFQNVIQVHQTLRLLQKNTSKTISHFDPRLPTRMKKCGRSHSQRFFHFYFILFLFLFFEIENWKNWKHQCLFYFLKLFPRVFEALEF